MSNKFHVFNPCAPFFHVDDIMTDNIEGVRKGIVTELFLTYLIYVVVIAKGAKDGLYPPVRRILNFLTLFS